MSQKMRRESVEGMKLGIGGRMGNETRLKRARVLVSVLIGT